MKYSQDKECTLFQRHSLITLDSDFEAGTHIHFQGRRTRFSDRPKLINNRSYNAVRYKSSSDQTLP
jgi:hypothetical protein